MKKIALFICTLILAAAVAFAVSADDAKFTVELTGPEVVNAGKTVDYVLTVKGIKLTDGILGLDLAVNYDTEVFELADVKTTQPDGWTTEVNKKTAGTVRLTAIETSANKDNAVKKDGVLKFTISLKVKKDASKTSEISLSTVECTGTDYESYTGTANRLTVKIRKALAAPSPVSFDNGVAKWSAVENADSYSVQIYKDG
ncbi:MAG: cohesin domain-containing protein, partial [Firmicutes bacterium]|nr:cohesin domain-containing protein [Candidatus Colimorpha enterica]